MLLQSEKQHTRTTPASPSLVINGCFFDDRTNAAASRTIWEAVEAGSHLWFIWEPVASNHASEPDTTSTSHGNVTQRFFLANGYMLGANVVTVMPMHTRQCLLMRTSVFLMRVNIC